MALYIDDYITRLLFQNDEVCVMMFNLNDHLVVISGNICSELFSNMVATHMWRTLARPPYFTNRGGLGSATFFIAVSVPCQVYERSYKCAMDINFSTVSIIFQSDFGTFPTA